MDYWQNESEFRLLLSITRLFNVKEGWLSSAKMFSALKEKSSVKTSLTKTNVKYILHPEMSQAK